VELSTPLPLHWQSPMPATLNYSQLCDRFFGDYGTWIGFMLASQALYHLSHASSPFCFSYFSDRVSSFLPRPT
jgi:hypothetical protein